MATIYMSEVKQACLRTKEAYLRAREIEEDSKRSEVYRIADREITFTWRVRCFDIDGNFDRSVEVACGPWWAVMNRNPSPGLQGAQGVSYEPQIVALKRQIESYLNALDGDVKWPDTLAEMGIK